MLSENLRSLFFQAPEFKVVETVDDPPAAVVFRFGDGGGLSIEVPGVFGIDLHHGPDLG